MLDSNNKHPLPDPPPGASHHLLRGGAGRLGAAAPGALRRCDVTSAAVAVAGAFNGGTVGELDM